MEDPEDIRSELIRAIAAADQATADIRDVIQELPDPERASWLMALATLKRADARKMTAGQFDLIRKLAQLGAIQVMQGVYPVEVSQ